MANVNGRVSRTAWSIERWPGSGPTKSESPWSNYRLVLLRRAQAVLIRLSGGRQRGSDQLAYKGSLRSYTLSLGYSSELPLRPWPSCIGLCFSHRKQWHLVSSPISPRCRNTYLHTSIIADQKNARQSRKPITAYLYPPLAVGSTSRLLSSSSASVRLIFPLRERGWHLSNLLQLVLNLVSSHNKFTNMAAGPSTTLHCNTKTLLVSCCAPASSLCCYALVITGLLLEVRKIWCYLFLTFYLNICLLLFRNCLHVAYSFRLLWHCRWYLPCNNPIQRPWLRQTTRFVSSDMETVVPGVQSSCGHGRNCLVSLYVLSARVSIPILTDLPGALYLCMMVGTLLYMFQITPRPTPGGYYGSPTRVVPSYV